MRERAALLIDDAAGGRQGQILVAEQELRREEFDGFTSQASAAKYRLGHAAQQADEVCVVDVQVDDRTADRAGIEKVFDPTRIGDDALEMPAQQASVFSA